MTIASKLSRRGFAGMLAKIVPAALIGSAVPAIAMAEPKSGRMTALGDKLRERWRAYALNRPAYENAQNTANELLYQKLISQPTDLSVEDDAAWRLNDEAESEAGYSSVAKVDEETSAAYWDTRREILRTPPASLSDLAVLANAAATANHDLWNAKTPDELDLEEEYTRTLIEAVLRLAKSELVLDGLPIPQCVNTGAWQRASEYWWQRNPDNWKNRLQEILADERSTAALAQSLRTI